MNHHIANRTRSHINYDGESDEFTITLRSSIRGLEGFVISIPREAAEFDHDNNSDFTYIQTDGTETESASVSSEEVRRYRKINFEKLNKFVVNKENCPTDECSVCLDGFKSRQHCRKLSCNHIFHKKCI